MRERTRASQARGRDYNSGLSPVNGCGLVAKTGGSRYPVGPFLSRLLNSAMQRQQFTYTLPKHLIATEPAAERSGSRLMVLDRKSGLVQHRQFMDLLNLLMPGDLLVFNDTRVIPARLHGHKESGGKVEILLERQLSNTTALVQIKASKSPKAGTCITLAGGETIKVLDRESEFFRVDFQQAVLPLLEKQGEMPLPPYMERQANTIDKERYQTVYAKQPGAVAAPTAGLHFDDDLLQQLEAKGINRAFVTLHVGAGTFQPVRVDDITEHPMHSEWLQVDEAVCEKIKSTKARGGRVIAVGTTSVRALESAAHSGEIQPFAGETQIFIYPPYKFKVIDALITNFHLPESTLLMLVSALAGLEPTLAAYKTAVEEQYRFFSYGDAMLLANNVS